MRRAVSVNHGERPGSDLAKCFALTNRLRSASPAAGVRPIRPCERQPSAL
jgi:hypothetical protein